MAVKTLNFENVIIHFPKIVFKKRTKNDQHKKEQETPLHESGQTGLGGEIETLVNEARIHFKDGGQ